MKLPLAQAERQPVIASESKRLLAELPSETLDRRVKVTSAQMEFYKYVTVRVALESMSQYPHMEYRLGATQDAGLAAHAAACGQGLPPLYYAPRSLVQVLSEGGLTDEGSPALDYSR